jgi:hypothetical protein
MTIWYILYSFGTFSGFWYRVPRKIWQPWYVDVAYLAASKCWQLVPEDRSSESNSAARGGRAFQSLPAITLEAVLKSS